MPRSEKTVVVFRKFPDGEIVAIFPYVIDHSNIDYPGVISDTRPAKPEEYASLATELTHIGYDLDIQTRTNIRPIFPVVKYGGMELFFASKSKEEADRFYSKNGHLDKMDTWSLSEPEFRKEWPDAKLGYDYFRNPRGVKEWRPEA